MKNEQNMETTENRIIYLQKNIYFIMLRNLPRSWKGKYFMIQLNPCLQMIRFSMMHAGERYSF